MTRASRIIVIGVALAFGFGVKAANAQAPQSVLAEFVPGSAEPSTSISAGLSAYQGWDQNLFGHPQVQPDFVNPLFTKSGYYSGIKADAAYRRRTRHTRWVIDANGEARYFPVLSISLRDTYGASTSWGALVARHTYVTFGAAAGHQSRFRLGSLSDVQGVAPDNPEEAGLPTAVAVGSAAERASFSIVQQLSSRSALTVRYADQRTTYDDTSIESTIQRAGAEFTRQLSKSFALNLGYEFRESRVRPGLGSYRLQAFSGGIAYRTGLTARTSLFAGFGVATVPRDNAADRTLVTGRAEIRHTFSRAWSGSTGYSRRAAFIEGIAAPVTVDAVNGQLTGFLTQKLSLGLNVDYVIGQVLAQPNADPYHNAQGGAGIDYVLARQVRAFARYGLYRYDFSSGSLIGLGVPDAVRRQVVLVGLTMSLARPLQ